MRIASSCVKHDSISYNHSASHPCCSLLCFLGALGLRISLCLSMCTGVATVFLLLKMWAEASSNPLHFFLLP